MCCLMLTELFSCNGPNRFHVFFVTQVHTDTTNRHYCGCLHRLATAAAAGAAGAAG